MSVTFVRTRTVASFRILIELKPPIYLNCTTIIVTIELLFTKYVPEGGCVFMATLLLSWDIFLAEVNSVMPVMSITYAKEGSSPAIVKSVSDLSANHIFVEFESVSVRSMR